MTTIVDGNLGVSYPYGATQSTGVGPAFSAYPTAAQSVSATTWTKLAADTEEYDTNSNYNNSTYRFTPTVAGYYQFNACWQSGSGGSITISLYKNGNQFKTGAFTAVNAIGGPNTIVSSLIYCNGSTDYIECYIYASAGTSVYQNSANSYFQGVMVRGA